MFIRTYDATLVGDGWNSVNNHLLLNMMCVFPASKEFVRALNTFWAHKKCGIHHKGDQGVLN
jgi:hypothetical protein